MIKVDRVGSAEEAAALEAAGADLIGVSLAADARFHDDRTVSVEQASAVGKALQRATLVAAISAYSGVADLNAVLFHADVLPEYRESWAFLRDRAPEFDDEFQVEDLDGLGRERPLVVGLDFTAANVTEIMAALPGVRGIALTLGGQARRGDARFHSYGDALAVVRAAVA